ncbi:MAG: peptidase U32 [Desulfuromonas sp.]|nr:MAG: peptidase U32 [Desulfuromonas sp.]
MVPGAVGRGRKPELLVPAGDLEKLRTALRFGADAVYVGMSRFGLRAMAGNFSPEQLKLARKLCRDAGCKLYLTLNAYLQPDEIPLLEQTLEELRPLELDAYIVSDPGVLATVGRIDPERVIHLSTQANTCNPAAAEFWREQGVSRINLARELSLDHVRKFRAGTKVELEMFVHGAMCVAISGRCLLSAALTGRSANRGACTHPCRWSYRLTEATRPDAPLTLEEDERGSYLFNSRDLCLLENVPEILAAGVNSLKIEGRMKSRYYVAAVTRVYRAALDRWLSDPDQWQVAPLWREELDRVSHRPYGTGFLTGTGDPQVHAADSHYQRIYDFIGVVLERFADGRCLVEGRNRFFPGEAIEVIGPEMRQEQLRVGEVKREDRSPLEVVQPNARCVMALPDWVGEGDLLRREKPAEDC